MAQHLVCCSSHANLHLLLLNIHNICDACVQINKVGFSVTGLGNLAGSLTIRASFKPVSDKRVSIAFEKASLVRAVSAKQHAAPNTLVLVVMHVLDSLRPHLQSSSSSSSRADAATAIVMLALHCLSSACPSLLLVNAALLEICNDSSTYHKASSTLHCRCPRHWSSFLPATMIYY